MYRIQRDGGVIAAAVNRAKPSFEELSGIFRGHIAENTLVLTDGLRSYNALETLADCTVVDVNHEKVKGIFHLNTVNSLHSYIKETFRCAESLKGTLFASLCKVSQNNYWHSANGVRNYCLVAL